MTSERKKIAHGTSTCTNLLPGGSFKATTQSQVISLSWRAEVIIQVNQKRWNFWSTVPQRKVLYKERTLEICSGVCLRLWLATDLFTFKRKWPKARKEPQERTSQKTPMVQRRLGIIVVFPSAKMEKKIQKHQVESSEGYCMSRHNIIKLLKTNDKKISKIMQEKKLQCDTFYTEQ